jgi:hypothetical protein
MRSMEASHLVEGGGGVQREPLCNDSLRNINAMRTDMDIVAIIEQGTIARTLHMRGQLHVWMWTRVGQHRLRDSTLIGQADGL